MNGVLRESLRSGERLLGTLVGMPSPAVVEVLAAAGFDWLFLDAEHGGIEIADLPDLLRAAGACPCLVRVPVGEPPWLARALDAGAAGVIVPQVNSAAGAAAAVRQCRYPPEGRRGAGLGRAQGYGLDAGRYRATANGDVAVVVQVEHVDAVERIHEIVAVPGVDAAFIGPYDLAGSLGHAHDVEHESVHAAVARVREACLAAGMPMGAFAANADAARPWLAQGFTLLAVASDTLLMGAAARDSLMRLRAG